VTLETTEEVEVAEVAAEEVLIQAILLAVSLRSIRIMCLFFLYIFQEEITVMNPTMIEIVITVEVSL
jgi:hypothetical protein